MPSSDDDEGTTSGGTPSEITAEHRTDWQTILKVTKIHKADQSRISQLAFATNIKIRIQKLPQENLTAPHVRSFI